MGGHYNQLGWKLLKASIGLICFSLFLLQMIRVWKEFANEETFVAVTSTNLAKMKLPTVTVCPLDAFKETAKDNVDPVVFTPEDIFINLDYFKTNPNFTIKATPSTAYGMCQTITYKEEVEMLQYQLELELSRITDYDVFFHEPGEESLLLMTNRPFEIKKETILAARHITVEAMDVILEKHVVQKLSRQNNMCKHGINILDYTNCVTDALRKAFTYLGPCTIPLLNSIETKDSTLETCKTDANASLAILYAEGLFRNILVSDQCERVCQEIKYEVTIRSYTKAQEKFYQMLYSDSGVKAWIYYETMRVEQFTERYVYGIDTALVAVGGYMGLFLGFSCLSLTLSLVTFIQEMLSRRATSKKVFDESIK